jgi:hypothetical protein
VIILHYGEIEVWYNPANIVACTRRTDRTGIGADVYSTESNEPQSVRERPGEIARLKAAWASRPHHGSENALIGVGLDDGVIVGIYDDVTIPEA